MKAKQSKLDTSQRLPEWQDEEPEERNRWRFLVVPAVVIVLVGALVVLLQSGQDDTVGATTQITFGGKATGTAPKVGAAAPDFTLPSLGGKAVSLSSYKGKVVLLNFFATWCPPCRAEMPDLESSYKELKDKGLEIIAVDLQEDQNTVSGYVKSLGLSFTILLDRGADVFGQYHVTGLPTSYFIDRDGVVREVAIGALNKKLIMQKLEKLF
jgi:peroxiredoxin